MVELVNPVLPISRQCRLLAVPRSSVYRMPAEVSAEDLATMALIDRQHLSRPYYGSRRITARLATQGHVVNRKRVQAPDAIAGAGGDLPAPEYKQAGGGAQDLSLPAARARDRAAADLPS
jgi:putative transposase